MSDSQKPTMSNRLECSLCLDRFNDPRIIGCFHTFCYQCLQRYLATHLNQQKFLCPVCRSENTLPKEGIAGLQKNFYVNEDTAKPTHPMCPSHPNEDLRFYCKTCNVAVCRDCKVISHTIHETDMLDNITESIKQKVENCLNNADKISHDSWVQVQKVLETERKMLDDIVDSMNRKANEIKSMIDNLFSGVTSHYTSNKRNMQHVDNINEIRKYNINRYRTMFSDAFSKNNFEVLETYKSTFQTDELSRLERAPSVYERLRKETVNKEDIASYTQKLNEIFDQLKVYMTGLQKSMPEWKSRVGQSKETLAPRGGECLSLTWRQPASGAVVPAEGSKAQLAVAVKTPAKESLRTTKRQPATSSVAPAVSTKVPAAVGKRPAEASPCPEPTKRPSRRSNEKNLSWTKKVSPGKTGSEMPSRGKHKSVMLTAEVMPGTSTTTAEEAKKLKADKPTESSTTEELNVYMIKTFKIRRDFITKEQPTIAQVKETYPELFRYRQIMVEFERIINTDVDHILQEYCVAHWRDIFDMCKKITSAASLLKQADEVKKENPSMKQYWDMVTALCLIPFMMKEKLCNLVIQVGKDEQVDPKGKIAPVLISKGTVFESDEFTIVAEEEVIQEFTEFTLAFASLFAMYWILNLKYPDSLQLTYSFIQKVMVNLNDGTVLPARCRDVQQNLLNSARARTRRNSCKKKHEKPESANGIK